MINLLILRTSMNVGGIERMVLGSLKLLDRSLFRVHLVTFTEGGLLLPQARAAADRWASIHRRRDPDLRLLLHLRRYIRRNVIQIIHSNNIAEMAYAYLASLGVPVRKVGWVHRVPASHRVGWHRRILARQDCAVFVSNSIRADLVGRGWKAKRMETIKNGVDLLTPAQPHSDDRASPDFTVCLIARFAPEKDHETFLKAMAHVKEQEDGKRIKAVLVGDGDPDLIRKSESLVSSLGLVDRVQFLGSRPEVSGILAEACCLVAPSIFESFSLTTLEAMAAGVPVVASDIPAHREITGNGKYGQLFRTGDPQDLSEKLLALANDTGMRKAYASVGYQRAKEYDIRKTVQETEGLYLSLVGNSLDRQAMETPAS